MKEEVRDKLNVLDPKFRKEIEKIFHNVNFSISMLYDAATKDKKTEIYNYSFFQTIFKMELEKAKRGLQKLSLFLLDIDHFKKINDTYGHFRADELLKQTAKILKKATRKSDIVARFGGEEFVVLLPGLNIEKAKEVTSRIKRYIEEDKFLKKHKLTISGGLTEYIKGDTASKMIKRVDSALYDAKKSGRNRLISINLKEKGEFNIKKEACEKIKKIKKIKKSEMLKQLENTF